VKSIPGRRRQCEDESKDEANLQHLSREHPEQKAGVNIMIRILGEKKSLFSLKPM
jgi:hypothetical protein